MPDVSDSYDLLSKNRIECFVDNYIINSTNYKNGFVESWKV